MRKYIFGIALLLLAGASASAVAQETINNNIITRFGALTVSDAGVLLFKGTSVQPKIEANDSLGSERTLSDRIVGRCARHG